MTMYFIRSLSVLRVKVIMGHRSLDGIDTAIGAMAMCPTDVFGEC